MMIQDAINAVYEDMVQWRRMLHAKPELSFKEHETSKFIYEMLESFGLDQVSYICDTAVVGLLKGGAGDGKCIALRADIDALPITEETGYAYASQNKGVMHACGHDGHAAMLLGVAKVLLQRKEQIKGSIKFIFQHAEEMGPGGAIGLVKAGVMENPHVDMILAAHLFPDEACGAVKLAAGPMTIGGTNIDVHVTGKGGHGAFPHLADDVILAACEYVVALQQAVSRCLDPKEVGVLSVTQLKTGTAPNILPNYAYISINPRYYSLETRDILFRKIREIAEGIETISGCRFEIKIGPSYPPVINDPEAVKLVEKVCRDTLGVEYIEEGYLNGGDDFSNFMLETGTPGAYFSLLAGHEGDTIYSNHHPRFNWREEAMKTGAAVLAQAALEYLVG